VAQGAGRTTHGHAALRQDVPEASSPTCRRPECRRSDDSQTHEKDPNKGPVSGFESAAFRAGYAKNRFRVGQKRPSPVSGRLVGFVCENERLNLDVSRLPTSPRDAITETGQKFPTTKKRGLHEHFANPRWCLVGLP
jgi:hypothetical protein